jgi:hypothetical protein
MGKAIIQSSLGAGRYAVKILFNNARVTAEKNALQELITDIDQALATTETKLNEAQVSLNNTLQDLYYAIEVIAPMDVLLSYQTLALEKKIIFDGLVSQKNKLKLQKSSSEKRIFELEKYAPDEFETEAWCIAFNENLTGLTKTIEIDYILERDPSGNQIRNDTGFWIPATQDQTTTTPPSGYEILEHAMASSPHAVYFNLAILPAVQRDQGRYRIATLNSINDDNNTGNITFDGQYGASDNSNLNTEKAIFPIVNDNQSQSLSDVQITYPPCNAIAFEVNDRVIVDLTGNMPEIIGFYSNPRKCRPWVWSNRLAFNNNGIHVSLGLVRSADNQGPISRFNGAHHVSGTYPGPYTHTVECTETSLGFTYIWQEIYNGVTFEYRQTYTRTGNAYQTATETLAGFEKQDYIWETTETIQTLLFINGLSMGNVYTYSGSSVNYTSSPSYGYSLYSEDSFTASGSQLCIYIDDGTVKAHRNFQCSGTRNNTYKRMDGNKTIYGDLRGLGNEQSSTSTVTSYWGGGHLTSAPLFPSISGFPSDGFTIEREFNTYLVDDTW